jgi:aspartate carbamoyltransferase catalytic subunit
MSENQIALENLVSMETLTNEEVMALIKRGIEFKNGAKGLSLAPGTGHFRTKPLRRAKSI